MKEGIFKCFGVSKSDVKSLLSSLIENSNGVEYEIEGENLLTTIKLSAPENNFAFFDWTRLIFEKLSQYIYAETDISLEERMDFISSDDDPEPFDESLLSWFDDLETERISELLSCLNLREKKVIILRYAYEHSLKEVAEMIGEPYSNTRAISSRAMEKLRSYAKKERDGEKQ